MFWNDMWGSYGDFLARDIKVKPKPTVLHQKTCPLCETKLVNVYYVNQLDKYICKRCIDSSEKEKNT